MLRAINVLSTDESLLTRWRGRCRELLVDEVQDVDRAQLRLALLLAAPANRIFLVGDDDQSIYGWRLADVRRVLGLAVLLPGLRRVDLEVNHRCPPPVVERAVRLVDHNRERFAKRITAGTRAKGSLVLAPDGSEETVRLRRALESWPDDGSTRAVLARTNRELLPAVAVALELGWPFRAPRIELPVESPLVDEALEQLAARQAGREPLLVTVGRLRTEAREGGRADLGEVLRNLLGWAARYPDAAAFAGAVRETRTRLATLRRDDAILSLATAHATKGLEFDHVVVIGMEDGRFPSARSVQDAADPARALEEERRLAYVAWTRARRTLTLLYDPLVPSPFLLEAFDPDELGLPRARRRVTKRYDPGHDPRPRPRSAWRRLGRPADRPPGRARGGWPPGPRRSRRVPWGGMVRPGSGCDVRRSGLDGPCVARTRSVGASAISGRTSRRSPTRPPTPSSSRPASTPRCATRSTAESSSVASAGHS